MTVKPLYLAETVVGALMVYASIQNYTFSSVVKNLLTGKLAGSVNSADALTSADAATPAANAPGGSTGASSGDYNSIGLALMTDYSYSAAAAAGITACIAGESGGNPESVGTGGCGLIGWTPPSSLALYGGTCAAAGVGYGGATKSPTADQVTADMTSQLGAVDKYNSANGSVSGLNAQTNPVDAADYYSQNFEKPAITDSDVRASVANSVFAYLSSGAVATEDNGQGTANIGHG